MFIIVICCPILWSLSVWFDFNFFRNFYIIIALQNENSQILWFWPQKVCMRVPSKFLPRIEWKFLLFFFLLLYCISWRGTWWTWQFTWYKNYSWQGKGFILIPGFWGQAIIHIVIQQMNIFFAFLTYIKQNICSSGNTPLTSSQAFKIL